MSVSHTEQQVEDRSKSMTRRLGWKMVRVGDHLTLCRKVMGRKPGEPLVRITEVEITAIREERLWEISHEDVIAEGFPDWSTDQFIEFFCRQFKVQEWVVVTVLEWRYLDG